MCRSDHLSHDRDHQLRLLLLDVMARGPGYRDARFLRVVVVAPAVLRVESPPVTVEGQGSTGSLVAIQPPASARVYTRSGERCAT